MKYQINDRVIYEGTQWVVAETHQASKHEFADGDWQQVPHMPMYVLESRDQSHDAHQPAVVVLESHITGKAVEE